MKYIGLLDCNNFFVSCERLFRPDLINRPVAVLSSNDGCIVARSKEIKDMGIPMGVPYFQVKDILDKEKSTLFSSHFALYRDISRRVFEVVGTIIVNIEQYSIDECFFEFESNEPEKFLWTIKRQVEQAVGIPVSIGAAASKTQAKYVNSVAKKTTGIAVWDTELWGSKMEHVALAEIWGVGAGRSRQFSEKGILTVLDLVNTEPQVVTRLFGIEGLRLRDELRGRACLRVERKKVAQKSIMSTRSFSQTTTDIDILYDAIGYHLQHCVSDLKDMELMATNLKILIAPSRHGDFMLQGSSLEVTLNTPTRDLFTLQKTAHNMLIECFRVGVPYKKAGVIMSNLVASESETGSLFETYDNAASVKLKSLTDAVLNINKRYGKNLLQIGRSESKGGLWQSKKNSLSPAYTTNWQQIIAVKA
jgi:DNA polymerase V